MRNIAFAALFISTALGSAEAQVAGGPAIAYVKVEGSAASIYLTSETGAGTVKLYTTPSKMTVTTLDMKPGGGELAFVERGKGFAPVLKIIRYDDRGIRVGQPQIVTGACNPDNIDYHPTEPRLLVSDICSQNSRIATMNTNGSGYSVLVTGSPFLSDARWLKDGISYVYVRAPVDGGALQICRNACNPDNGELLRTVSGLSWMDTARTRNTLLFDEGGTTTSEIDADSGALLRANFISGTDGHYSPDDLRVLYETPHSARGDYLRIRNTDGSFTAVSPKGEYGPKDWRPAAASTSSALDFRTP